MLTSIESGAGLPARGLIVIRSKHDVRCVNCMHRIYVIRHGETEWSAAGKHTSHTDIALTARGENQVARLSRASPYGGV